LYERHFNQMQTTYRTLASTWLLGLFAAAGFLLGGKDSRLPLDANGVLALLGLLAAVGITLLWMLDLRVYAGLLRAYFDAGVALEAQHPWLPAVRSAMLRDTRNRGPGPRVARYYIAGTIASLVVSLIGGIRALDSLWARSALGGAYALACVCVVVIFGTRSGRTRRSSSH